MMTMGMSRFRTATLSLALALLLVVDNAVEYRPVASAATGHRREEADFDWAIEPMKDSPVIAFNNASMNNEIIFSYDIPTLHANKTYSAAVYRNDCTTLVANNTALRVRTNSSIGGELVAFVNVNQTSVIDSPFWRDVNQTAALLSFCFRVDLYLYNESINFHETNMTIAIDMTSGFELSTGTPVNSAEQQYADTMADYPVIAYYCDDKNEVVLSEDVLLTDGGTLQFCVQIDPAFERALYVRSLLKTSLDQGPSDGSEPSHADIVSDSTPDPFTAVRCESGVCNILHHLSSQWFSTAKPPDVVTSGVAVLAFGSPSVFTDTVTSGRRLSSDPHLVPLYGYDGPNITVVNRTTDQTPNITVGGATGKFRFLTRVAPPPPPGPSALEQGVKVAAYVAAGVAGVAIAALLAAKALATTALATGASGAIGDTGAPHDIECDGEGTDENDDEDGEEYSNDGDEEDENTDDGDDEEDESGNEDDEDEDNDDDEDDENKEEDEKDENNDEGEQEESKEEQNDENNDEGEQDEDADNDEEQDGENENNDDAENENNLEGEHEDDENNDGEQDEENDNDEAGNEEELLGDNIV